MLVFILLLVIGIRSLTLPGASEGLHFLFSPDFSKVTAGVVLTAMGLDTEKHPVPADEVQAAGLESITNLVVRRRYGEGRTQEDAYTQGVVSGQRRAGGTNRDLGLFIEDDWQIGPLLINGGLRADVYKLSTNNVTAAGVRTADVAYNCAAIIAEAQRAHAAAR